MSSHHSDPGPGPGPDSVPTPKPEKERHASWTELFFDLVAVAGVASLAHLLVAGPYLAALGLYTLLYLAFWLAWTTFMLYGNVSVDSTRLVRLLVGMFGLGVMAASVPGVSETVLNGARGGAVLNTFALAYVLSRVYGARAWRQGEVLLDFPVVQHTIGVLPWVASLWVEEPWKVALWTAGVVLDLLLVFLISGNQMLERHEDRFTDEQQRRRPTPRAARTGPLRIVGVRTEPGHLAERLGLFVIIVLGEGVVQVVNAAAETEYGLGMFAASLASFVLLTGIFGLSVVHGFAGLPHLRPGSVDARIGLGLHCLVTGVIATLAVSLATVVESAAEPLTDGWRWLLCGAVAAYFALGLVASVASRGFRPAAAAASVAAGIGVPILLGVLAPGMSATALVICCAVVVLAHLWGEGRAARRQDRTTDLE